MPFVEYDEVEAVCSDCGRLFRSEEALESHRGEVHRETPHAPQSQPRVACSVCGQKFRSVGALSEHNRRNHTG